MIVKAKMECKVVKKYGQSEQVELTPVTTGPENESYSKWTPDGKLELMITNPAVFGFFQPEKEYFVDIVAADPDDPANL